MPANEDGLLQAIVQGPGRANLRTSAASISGISSQANCAMSRHQLSVHANRGAPLQVRISRWPVEKSHGQSKHRRHRQTNGVADCPACDSKHVHFLDFTQFQNAFAWHHCYSSISHTPLNHHAQQTTVEASFMALLCLIHTVQAFIHSFNHSPCHSFNIHPFYL